MHPNLIVRMQQFSIHQKISQRTSEPFIFVDDSFFIVLLNNNTIPCLIGNYEFLKPIVAT